MGSNLGDRYNLILPQNNTPEYYAVRSPNICGKLLVGVPWGMYDTWNRLNQKQERKKRAFSYGNAWPFLTFSKGCGRWGHVFATTSASPSVGPEQKIFLSLSSTVMAASMIPTTWYICETTVLLFVFFVFAVCSRSYPVYSYVWDIETSPFRTYHYPYYIIQ